MIESQPVAYHRTHRGTLEVIAGAVGGLLLMGVISGFAAMWRPVQEGTRLGVTGWFEFPAPAEVAMVPSAVEARKSETPRPRVRTPLVPDLESAVSRVPPELNREQTEWETSWPLASSQPTQPGGNLNSPGFRRAAQAAEKSDPAAAVVIIEQFRAANPDPYYTPHLDKLLDIALDRLYWQRAGQLIEQRQRVSQQMNALRVEQSRLADPVCRAQMGEQITQLRTRLNQITDDLETMGYSAATAPDLQSPEQLRGLRAERDTFRYETWKNRVRTTILRTGAPPWGGS